VPEVTASGATAAVKGTFDKTIKVVVDIFVPLGAGIAGFFMPTVLGGGYSISNAIYAATNRSGPAGTIDRVAWGVQALINAAVGAAFWSLRKMDGIIAKAIGGAIGGFFLGGSVGCLPGVFGATQPPQGAIDGLVNWMKTTAAE
jgi:hypothetical protein